MSLVKFDKFENRDITVKLYAQFDSNSINLSEQNAVLLIPRNMTKSKPNKSQEIFAPYLLSQGHNQITEAASQPSNSGQSVIFGQKWAGHWQTPPSELTLCNITLYAE